MSQDHWFKLMIWKFNVLYRLDHLIVKQLKKFNINKNKLTYYNQNNIKRKNKLKMICRSDKFIVIYFVYSELNQE